MKKKTPTLDASNVVSDLARMSNTSLFVAGDLMLDEYLQGNVSRISPEAPVPVLLQDHVEHMLGGAGNVAANVAAFNAEVTLLGRIGEDEGGRFIRDLCEKAGIHSHSLITSALVPTTRKTRLRVGHQQLIRIDTERVELLTSEEEDEALLLFLDFAKSKKKKALILSDYAKGFLTSSLIKKLISASRKHRIPVITDPKSQTLAKYDGSTVIKPNLGEGRQYFRLKYPEEKFKEISLEASRICDHIIKSTKIENVVLSLSEQGVYAKGKLNQKGIQYLAPARQVADVSGAGDTMIAFLAMAMASEIDFVRGVELSNLASGIVCGKPGAATVSTSEFLAEFKSFTQGTRPEKILTQAELVSVVDLLRREKKVIGFTNGCFDLIHSGNLHLLQSAKRECDILVVALNSDESARRIRSGMEPLQAERDRAAILAGFASVDYVTIFSESTADRLISEVKPDLYFKGGDQPLEKITELKELKRVGTQIVIIPPLLGYSSTSLRKRAANA